MNLGLYTWSQLIVPENVDKDQFSRQEIQNNLGKRYNTKNTDYIEKIDIPQADKWELIRRLRHIREQDRIHNEEDNNSHELKQYSILCVCFVL